MELTVEFILNSLLALAVIFLCFFLFKEKKKNLQLSSELQEYNLNSNSTMIGRGKFSELGLMSAGIAHELSNPLSVIVGRTNQLLRIYRDPDKQKDLAQGLNQIGYSAERMSKIIQGMREYIYRNDQQFEDLISLEEILDHVLLFCGQRLRNHGIELRLINVENIYLSGHRGQYEQAILNLINNAFDAVDKLNEKWIEITAVMVKDTVEIFFKDSGHGIPVDIRKKMLDPFFTTKKERGTGLGLTLVKGIAEKHGGDLVYVENAENTTFLLELPKAHNVSNNIH